MPQVFIDSFDTIDGRCIRADVRLLIDPEKSLTLRGVRVWPSGDTFKLVFPGVRNAGERDHRDSVVLPPPWRLLVVDALLGHARTHTSLAWVA